MQSAFCLLVDQHHSVQSHCCVGTRHVRFIYPLIIPHLHETHHETWKKQPEINVSTWMGWKKVLVLVLFIFFTMWFWQFWSSELKCLLNGLMWRSAGGYLVLYSHLLYTVIHSLSACTSLQAAAQELEMLHPQGVIRSEGRKLEVHSASCQSRVVKCVVLLKTFKACLDECSSRSSCNWLVILAWSHRSCMQVVLITQLILIKLQISTHECLPPTWMQIHD